MSLPHILLGLLAKPASGYDLQKEIDTSLSHFWSVHLPQIYPALRKLEEDGLVISDIEPSDIGPPRRVYQRTESGLATLVEWLSGGPIMGNERRHYLAQIYFLDAVTDKKITSAFMHDLSAMMAARLEALSAVEKMWREEFGARYPDDLPDDEFFKHLTFDLGKEISKVYVEWAARSLERLSARA